MIYFWLCWCLRLFIDVQCVPIHDTVHRLSQEVANLQVQRNKQGNPPFSWKEDAGIYPSHVKLNFHGEVQMAEIRELFKVFDNNMFATAWITTCLLEAAMYGVGPNPSAPQIDLSLKAIGQYHDKNKHHNNSIMTFWPQVYNASTKTWESAPKNLLDLFDLTNGASLKPLEDFLKLIGLKDIAKVMDTLLKEKNIFLRAFHIPPDFDDTFINLGLGSLLKESKYSDLFTDWANKNTNISSVLVALKKYAYRPWSRDSNQNSIDPRTYFYLRNFLEENREQSMALVPTWIQNVAEAKTDYYNGVAMPFTINNVDVTVSANVIFGLTAGVLTGMIRKEDFDEDIQNIYNHTTLLISYELQHNFSNRRDLALTYYPSKFECYWFVSRTLALLRRYKENRALPFWVMEAALGRFAAAFRGSVIEDINDTSRLDDKYRIYYDDFLGDGDFSIFGKPERRAEDRLFTSSMALNTLLDAFTVFNTTSRKLHWTETGDMKNRVKSLVDGTAAFLNEFILHGKYKTWNAFFSGSGKGRQSMPFSFPANRLEYFNGTKFKPDKFPPSGTPFVIGFEGVVDQSEYNQMLKQKHFGQYTAIDFQGFNPTSEPNGFFPFWSSDAYTYATAMLGLSKYLNIEDTKQ